MARRSNDFDVIILGSGSGGGVAANALAAKGKRVAIVEPERRLGGECPNWACVPTKALLTAADAIRVAKKSADFGVSSSVKVDFKKVRAWKDLVVSRTGTSHAHKLFEEKGIKVIHGKGHFLDGHTVSVAGRRYKASKFIIATGTHNFIPPIDGLKETGFITFREAIDLPHPPKSIFIIGGGAIGCEFAELFITFGSKVHLIEVAPRLLGREEPEAADLTKAVLQRKGVEVITGGSIHSIRKKGNRKVVHYSDGSTAFTTEVDEILIASGKRPNLDIGLENAGVGYDKHGIKTNSFMQTSSSHIYAAGDVVGPYQFTHTAAYQSNIAAHNMYARKSNKVPADYSCIPRCVFVAPEVASVGMTESEVKEKGVKPKVSLVPISTIGRSNVTNKATGLVKVVANKQGRILGATIVASRAGEMIHELALAIHLKATADDVATMVHAFPTWSEAVRIACHKIAN